MGGGNVSDLGRKEFARRAAEPRRENGEVLIFVCQGGSVVERRFAAPCYIGSGRKMREADRWVDVDL